MTTPPLPALSPPRRSRLWLWLTLGGLAVLIIVGIPAYLFYRVAYRFDKEYAPVAATLPAELAATNKEGLPTTPEELRPKPPVPDADNAAPLYRKLNAIYNKRSKTEREADGAFLSTILKQESRTKEDQQTIRAFLKKHVTEIKIAEQAAKRPRCDFNRDWKQGLDVSFPEYGVMRDATRWLALRAILLSDENKPSPAFQDLALGASIGKHAASDPIVISVLVKIAIRAILHRQFVAVLQRHHTPDALRAAEDSAAAFDRQIDLRHAFAGELVLGRVSMRKIRDSGDFVEQMRQQGVFVPASNPQIQHQMADAWQSRAVAYWRSVQSSLAASNGDLLAFEEQMQRIQKEVHANRFAPGQELNAILVPVFEPFPAKIMQDEATNHLRNSMIALLKYHQTNGKFPDLLTAIPQSEITDDPFTNKPLIYKKTGDGFLLYSIGANRQDDGGSAEKSLDNLPLDFVIKYP